MRHAMIMAGGRGTRLWPMSREDKPKQLIDFIERGGRTVSLLALAADRLGSVVPPQRRLICTAEAYRPLIRQSLPAFDDEQILGEPTGRDTVNAVGLTAAVLAFDDPDAIFAVLTADQLIEPEPVFAQAIAAGFALVEDDPSRLVTFGITPTHPATGFGYLERAEAVTLPAAAMAAGGPAEAMAAGGPAAAVTPAGPTEAIAAGGPAAAVTPAGPTEAVTAEDPAAPSPANHTPGGPPAAFRVARFVEKPDRPTAERYLASGRHFWNAGMFVFHAGTFLELLARHQPDSHAGLMEIQRAWPTPDRAATLASVYPRLPKVSVDYAIMEPAGQDPGVTICGVEMAARWLDVGSWPSFAATLKPDADGNRTAGRSPAVLHGCRDTLVVGDRPGHTLALLGCDGLTVVHTETATLVMPTDQAEQLKELHALLADELK